MNSLLISMFILVLANISLGQDCNDGMRKFDSDMARFVTFANSGRQFPISKGAPLKKWCDESAVLVRDMEAHKGKCFRDLSKQVMGVILYSVKSAMRQYCTKDSPKLTELIAAVPCVNKNDPAIGKCYTNFIDGVLGAKNAPENQRIPHMCCEYARMFPCFEEKLTTAPRCSERNVESVSDLIRNIIGNVVDLICTDYVEGSDKCESLGKPPRKKKSQRRTKSFAPPVLDLLASFPSV